MALLTLSDAKAQLNIEGTTENDDEIRAYVDSVSAVVERQTGEVVVPRAVEEFHAVSSQFYLLLWSIPVIDVISVTDSDGETWDVSKFTVDKRSGMVTTVGKPFRGSLTVTIQAGYNEIPPNYNLAARIILQRLWETQRGPAAAAFGTGPTSFENGGMPAIPPRARQLLGSQMPGIA